MRALAAFVSLAGCYDPAPQAGSPCADGGRCPSGLVCSPATQTCEREAQPTVDAPSADAGPDAPPQGLVPCLREDFNDGDAAGWMTPEGTWSIVTGPDGSAAFGATAQSSVATHPELFGIREARVTVDFRIDSPASGDFFVRLYEAGTWIAAPPMGKRYTAGIFAMGSDDTVDRIYVTLPPETPVELASRATTVPPLTWHRLVVTYGVDRSIQMDLDGAAYLSSGPDSRIPPPLDIAFRFWAVGAIDNIAVDCAR